MTEAHPAAPARLAAGAAGLARVGPPLLFAALLLGGAWLIAAHPAQPVWDQKALLEARFEAPHHPSPARGFTSQLVVALLHAVSPWPESGWNEQVRLLAMALYTGAAALLARALLRGRGLLALFAVLLFTSQYPFLWLSSELFTGAFLCLALWAWATNRPPPLVGLLLALFALCKPDLIFVATVLLAWWCVRESREDAALLAGSFAASLVLLLLPGTLQGGLGYFSTYNDAPGGRSFASFRQHYAALIAHLQVLGPPPNPWSLSDVYFDPLFPGAHTMADVVLHHFPQYAEFVALSCVRGLFRGLYVFHFALPALPLLWWAGRRAGAPLSGEERALLLTFAGVLPFVLFAFPHVRYLARYYPVFCLLVLLAWERVGAGPETGARGPGLRLAAVFVAFALAENARRLAVHVAGLGTHSLYWFPD